MAFLLRTSHRSRSGQSCSHSSGTAPSLLAIMFNFSNLYGEDSDDPLAGSARQALPLKQRTSSIDVRKDFSTETWTSLLHLISPKEFVITVNNFAIFRRHISWAISNGGDLRNYITQRYASNMVFMSLLLGAELGVLFNSSQITTSIRYSLSHGSHHELQFWIGISLLLSVVFTILSLFTTFTAWGMVSAISDENAHCMLRSSIGQYVVELPQKFIVMSIYSFFWIFVLFLSLLLPAFGFYSVMLTVLVGGLFFHVVAVFSAFGRLILHTGAIAPTRIFDEQYEQSLLPQSLHSNLIKRARAELTNKTSVVRQYRRNCEPIDRDMSQEDMIRHIRGAQPLFGRSVPPPKGRRQDNRKDAHSHKRADSTVRFADQLFNFNASTSQLNVADEEDPPRKRTLSRERNILEEDPSTAMEEGIFSATSSQDDDHEPALARDKEVNWFAAIASSINTSDFDDLPIQDGDGLAEQHEGEPATARAPAPKAKKKRRHIRVDSKVRFAEESGLETTEYIPKSPAIEVASTIPSPKPLDSVLKVSTFSPEMNEELVLPSMNTNHAPAATDAQRNWFSSIASSVDATLRPPRAPKPNGRPSNKATFAAAMTSQDTVATDRTERADEQKNLLGSNKHDDYSSVGR
jgi:hypothetical protein